LIGNLDARLHDADRRLKSLAKPPDAELDLLAALCRAGEATARELRDAVDAYRPMAHGSVLTLLGRLEEKRLVDKRKGDSGKAFVYQPTAAGRAVFRPVMKNFVEQIFGGSSVSFIASLFESKAPTAAEIDELQRMLDDLRAKRGKKR
jgi:predicted transcriptional regulator